MSFSFKRASSVKMDPEMVRVAAAVVAEHMFGVQSSISALQDQMSDFQDRLDSLEATAAVATKEQTALQTLSSRLDSLEATATATKKGLEELLASPQDKPPQQPVIYYDFRQLEEKVRKLEADLIPAKLAQSMPSAENFQKKFIDIEKICDDVKERCSENEDKVSSLEEQIEHWRIGWAIFALNAINLKESDRRDCLNRFKDEEERMRRIKFGVTSESPGNSSPLTRRSRLPTITRQLSPPCLNSIPLNRSQVHPQPSPQSEVHM